LNVWDGTALTLTLLLYVGTVIVAARSIRREPDLTEREMLWGTALVILVPLIGILLWVVVSPDRAWRIFSRRPPERHAPAATASRSAGH
jgi:hypothetical protein